MREKAKCFSNSSNSSNFFIPNLLAIEDLNLKARGTNHRRSPWAGRTAAYPSSHEHAQNRRCHTLVPTRPAPIALVCPLAAAPCCALVCPLVLSACGCSLRRLPPSIPARPYRRCFPRRPPPLLLPMQAALLLLVPAAPSTQLPQQPPRLPLLACVASPAGTSVPR